MRKFLIVSATAIGLASCVTPGGVPTSGGNQTVNQIIAATQQACAFAPTASTVANILATFVPGLNIVADVANAICGAVSPPLGIMSARAVRAPAVNGVKVRGTFTNNGRVLR